MNAAPLSPALRRTLRAARLRAVAATTLTVLPVAASLLLLLGRYAPVALSAIAAALLAAAWLALSVRAWRALDQRWLARGLNTRLPALEDSAELLMPDAGALPPMAALQRTRLDARLAQTALPDLRPQYPRRRLLLAWLAGLALIAVAYEGKALRNVIAQHHATPSPSSGEAAVTPSIHILPPAYTGLSASEIGALDLKAPVGSTLQFTMGIAQPASTVTLAFADGRKLGLKQQGDTWQVTFKLDASALYRLELDGASTANQPLHRLEALPDRPPEVLVHAPDKTLNLLADKQKSWELSFEASDDYGLGPAELSISLAQGSGDNVKTTERKLTLDGRGDARHRNYNTTLDLAALGFARGDDLIVRLSVADNRQPQANLTRSASFILRWPEQAASQGSGVEGPVQNATPAFFRSERQLIIDTEALQSERGNLEAARFAARADALGVDQKMLRLRYGQFLGEEFESEAEHDPRKEGQKEGGAEDHDAPPAAAPGSDAFGKEGNILHEYGHIHDIAEATTLLDPETRKILKSALDEMWQAELRLRQAQPEQALPFEYKALDYIKQVQQAERIYLARAGLELPQPDMGRRLSGDRSGLTDRSTALPAPQSGDGTLTALYRAASSGGVVDVTALQDWLHAHADVAPNALGLIAAADKLQRDPSCQSCRSELQSLLWPLLPSPPTAITPRSAADAAGSAYLDALPAPAAAGATP